MTPAASIPALLRKIARTVPRERRQNGWVEKTGLKEKKWVGFYYEYVKVDSVEKRRKREVRLGLCSEMTKTQAKHKLQDLLRGGKPQTKRMVFEQLGEWYLEARQSRWKPKTYKTACSSLRRQVYPLIGSKLISEIAKSDIEYALGNMAKTCRLTSLRRILADIKGAFELAVDDDLIGKNPARKVILPRAPGPCERFLSLEECQNLLRAASGRERLLLALMLQCGLRPGEAFALRSDDFYVSPGCLRVDEAVTLGKVGDLKTKSSKRLIPLHLGLYAEVLAYLEGRQPPEFLFATSSGRPHRPNRFMEDKLQPIARSVGILDLTYQAMRRTTATHFQKHGGVKDAQTMLGHATAQTTLKHYQKPLESSVRTSAEGWFEEMIGRKIPATE